MAAPDGRTPDSQAVLPEQESQHKENYDGKCCASRNRYDPGHKNSTDDPEVNRGDATGDSNAQDGAD